MDYRAAHEEAESFLNQLPDEAWPAISLIFSLPRHLARKHGIPLGEARKIIHTKCAAHHLNNSVSISPEEAAKLVPDDGMNSIGCWGFI